MLSLASKTMATHPVVTNLPVSPSVKYTACNTYMVAWYSYLTKSHRLYSRNVDMLKSCITNNVKKECGDVAARQQSNVVNKMTSRQVKGIECDPSKYFHSQQQFQEVLTG